MIDRIVELRLTNLEKDVVQMTSMLHHYLDIIKQLIQAAVNQPNTTNVDTILSSLEIINSTQESIRKTLEVHRVALDEHTEAINAIMYHVVSNASNSGNNNLFNGEA